jgi:D-alanyl-D-alanine carboxypeptidase (penicillin-binding protein 5/6)
MTASTRRRAARGARGAIAALALLLTAVAMPARASAGTTSLPAQPPLSVTGACLIDAASGQVLDAENPDGRLAIASTTKLMTALVVLQHVKDMDTIFTQNDWVPAAVDSQIGLSPGERMSVRDLMMAMMLPSADDAAEDLAYNVGRGSIARFVAMMNGDAVRLGLTRTHYTTPIGLDTPGNYSSPCDLAKLARYDLTAYPFFRRMVALKGATLTTGSYVRTIVNRDVLLDEHPWINGVKTGHTLGAGYVLVSSGTQHGLTLIGSVLGTASETARDANALSLLTWGFANFHDVTAITRGTVVARLPVKDRPGFREPVLASTTYAALLERGARLTFVSELPRELAGPLARHAIVGRLVVLAGGRRLAAVPVWVARRLPAVSSLAIAARFLERASTLLLILAALAAVAGLLVVRRERARAREIELSQPR